MAFRYKLDKAIIKNDLTNERPQWILSAYGPGRDAPQQIFGGYPREQSFEELRFHHYELVAVGNEQQAIQEAQILLNNAEQQMQLVLQDLDGAIKFVVDGENQHPNRIDICKVTGDTPAQFRSSAGSQQSSSTFGRPSDLGQPFSAPTAPQPSTSTFGRPSSTFGQPSAPVSKFGQPSAFGQPTALGRPATSFGQPTPGFGQNFGSTPAFGVPAAPLPFAQGQQTAAPNQFGPPSVPAQPNPFGQPTVLTAPSPFTPATGTPWAPAPSSATPANPFSVPAAPQSTNTLGRPPLAQSGPFNESATGQTANTFGQAATSALNATLGQAGNTQSSANIQTAAQHDSQNQLTSWKGKPVTYVDQEPCVRRNDGFLEKIWFPNGPPVFKKTSELPVEAYDEATKENYKYLREHGAFKDGIMPDLPPRREWCSWNF